MRPGESFENPEVALNYRYRPSYPPELCEALVSLSPSNDRALDLGCGPGKIAIELAESFKTVTAVDASETMLRLGKENQREGDIRWIQGLAETVDLGSESFDLVVAGASIHWMNHGVLFPKLFGKVAPDHIFAAIDGDGAYNPPWKQEWDTFLGKWLPLLTGKQYQPNNKDSDFNHFMNQYQSWIDIKGERNFDHTVSQSIDDFIKCQHSRDTFAPAKLGDQSGEFDSELQAILEPYSEQGLLHYTVRTRLEWGNIK